MESADFFQFSAKIINSFVLSSYFKGRNFRETKFRDFTNFRPNRESLTPRKMPKGAIRESLFPRKMPK